MYFIESKVAKDKKVTALGGKKSNEKEKQEKPNKNAQNKKPSHKVPLSNITSLLLNNCTRSKKVVSRTKETIVKSNNYKAPY